MNLSPTTVEVELAIARKMNTMFRDCFKECKLLPGELKNIVKDRHVSREELRKALVSKVQQRTSKIYERLALGLIDSLSSIDEIHYPMSQKVNFFFWPGYTSRFNDSKRLFCRGLDGQMTGCGYWGDPSYALQNTGITAVYNSSPQVDWFRGGKAPNNLEHRIAPPNLHEWFVKGDPRIGKERLPILSFTLCASPSDQEHVSCQHPEYQSFALPQTESGWAEKVAEFLNRPEISQLRDDARKRFPDRMKEKFADAERRRKLRFLMADFWFNSVFRWTKPSFTADYMAELDATWLGDEHAKKEFLSTMDTLINETRWDAEKTDRAQFKYWLIISPEDMLTPVPALDSGNEDALQDLGSAMFLCSHPLTPRFISIVRPWIRSIYAMIRNAEFYGVNAHRQRDSKLQGRHEGSSLIAHELSKILTKDFSLIPSRYASCEPKDIALRRFAWETVLSFNRLHQGYVTALDQLGLDPNENKVKLLGVEMTKPLLALARSEKLDSAFLEVAARVFAFHNRRLSGKCQSIRFFLCSTRDHAGERGELWPGAPPPFDETVPESISCEAYSLLFLFVSEIVGNYCVHRAGQCQDDDYKAQNAAFLSAFQRDSGNQIEATIIFEQTVILNATRSVTLNHLAVFLETCKIGSIEYLPKEKNATREKIEARFNIAKEMI